MCVVGDRLGAMVRGDDVKRMTPAEALAYWREHEQRFADIDWERDPDGLGAYLGPGQPAWLNARYAALQRGVFDRVLARLPSPAPGERALDIGCGAGRWTRRVAQQGYAAVGIDLQERIIAANRERFPAIEWRALALQELPADERFALVTSVGVLEMIPYAEQPGVIGRVAAVLAPGGHAIVLTVLRHPSPQSYPHSVGEWARLFDGAGLRVVQQRSYCWEPLRRTAAAAVAAISPTRVLTPRVPTETAPLDDAQPAGETWRAPRGMRVVAAVDDRLEPLLQRLRPHGARARWSAFVLNRP
jgi:2-polyprenyl-3-methyl-5-hydroxy-6-metoxy-1,4-benzoquinol methylase